jgi:predicted RND superfamily exporter protein
MLRRTLGRVFDFVTDHSRVTLLAVVLASALVLAGIPQIDTSSQAGASQDAFDDVERVKKAGYVQEQYGSIARDTNRTVAVVYVHNDRGNVLSRESLLAELRYQRAVLEDDSLQAALHEDGIVGFSNLVARRAAEREDPSLDEQIAALADADDETVEGLVAKVLREDPRARQFLPADHDPSSTTATDRRLLVVLDTRTDQATRSEATAALHEAAEARRDDGYFTVGEHEVAAAQSQGVRNLVELVLPLALLLILSVLAFSYRDVVDIVVGMTGVVLSVLWMLGLLGWMGVAAGVIVIIPIVLITGLSIDFGFHVFNRYREERGPDDPIRPAMSRGVQLVATALLLVTATAAIGFLSNLANPLPVIRNLGVTITLGVVSALVIFTTAVPALKVSVDGLLERAGLDRHREPLGRGRYLGRALTGSVTLARRAAPVVVVVAVLVGSLGGAAWGALDQESFQQSDDEVAQWKQDLPGPLGWEVHEYQQNRAHVDEVYSPPSEESALRSQMLVEGDVTDDDTLERVHRAEQQLADAGILLDRPGVQTVRSPLTVMRAVAARDDQFAAAFADADTDGNGVPDTDLASLYDLLYETDEDAARMVLERDGGKYRSLLVIVVLDVDVAEADETVEVLEEAERTVEDGGGLDATLVGPLAVNTAVLQALTDGILRTMLLALAAITVTMLVVFRLTHDSASLGLVVAVPIALVIGLVVGGMYLLEVPLTLLTALLMSLVIGLGIDYNIHVGDRFADELRAGDPPAEALDAAVTGTGGALVGSTLTSAGAFATLVLVPDAQLRSFGVIVVLALSTAFLASVLVLPSMLWLWADYTGAGTGN